MTNNHCTRSESNSERSLNWLFVRRTQKEVIIENKLVIGYVTVPAIMYIEEQNQKEACRK